MHIDFHKSFKKQFAKLSKKIQKQFDERLLLFYENRFIPLLNYHELSGQLIGMYSINITSDVRAQFYYTSPDHAVFLHIGTHSQLYGK
jgi:mRNA-degrading endonuclease YafQ of YafQ-DinJ toxin-antitoxin module